jgi:hypothetical protein
MARRSTADKFQEYEKLKADAHAKVETLTPIQLRKFLAAYKNPGGWNKQESEPQVAAREIQ